MSNDTIHPQTRSLKPRTRLFLANIGARTIKNPSITAPLGLLSLAAWLRDRFPLDVMVLDQRLENCSVTELVKRAQTFGADVLGFRVLSADAGMMRDATLQARQALPHSLILLGGPHPSAFGAQALEGTAANAAVVGEGELTFERIMEAYLGGDDFGHIPGLAWRTREGEVLTNPGSMPLIEDLDKLPFPAYDLVDVRKYWQFGSFVLGPPRPHISMFTTRGCPYQCIYCHRVFGKQFRFQSAERVVAEMDFYRKQYGIRDVDFIDDSFNLNKNRVLAICDSIRQSLPGTTFGFPNAIRCDILNREIVDAMVGAGLQFTSCALESGSPRIQEYMGKRLNIPKFLENVELLAARRVFTHGFVMLGFPTETEAELKETVRVTCESQLDAATFFSVVPFPNTDLYRLVERDAPEKLKQVNYEGTYYTGARINLSTAPDKVFFRCLHGAWHRFYMNPRRLVRLVRHYPRPLNMIYHVPQLLHRMTLGFHS